MTFERTNDGQLVGEIIRRAWDRPRMMRDGASLDRIPSLDGAQCFLAVVGAFAVAVFICFETDNETLDIHVCMVPECRGSAAMLTLAEFFGWLKRNTQYKRVTGAVPGYNRPMIRVALAAGARKISVIPRSVPHEGSLHDAIVMERRLA